MLSTWYCVADGEVYIVTADTVELALLFLERDFGLKLKADELFNVIKTSRWVKHVARGSHGYDIP